MNTEKPEFSSRLAPALDDYAGTCLARHVQTTIMLDFRAMKSLDEFLDESGYDGGEISENMMDAWIVRLSSKFAPATVNQYKQKARQILRSAYKSFGIQSPFVDDVSQKKHRPDKPVFQSDLRQVLDAYADRCLAEHADNTLKNDFAALQSLDNYLYEVGYHGGMISIDMLEDWVWQYSQLRPKNWMQSRRIIGFATGSLKIQRKKKKEGPHRP